jgi:hypothetical protein
VHEHLSSYITEISHFNQAPLSSEEWITTFSLDSTDSISASFGSYSNQTVQSFRNWVTISKECTKWRRQRQREWNKCQQVCAETKVIKYGGQNFIGTVRDKGCGVRYSCHDLTGARNKCSVNTLLNIPFWNSLGPPCSIVWVGVGLWRHSCWAYSWLDIFHN